MFDESYKRRGFWVINMGWRGQGGWGLDRGGQREGERDAGAKRAGRRDPKGGVRKGIQI